MAKDKLESRKEYYRNLAQTLARGVVEGKWRRGLIGAPKRHQQKPQPDISAHEIEALQEQLAVYGFDAQNADTRAKWQELNRQVNAGRITEKDHLRSMALYLWQQGDKQRRAHHASI